MIHSSIRLPFSCRPVSGQLFHDAQGIEHRRTALREATYIRRTHFTKAGRTLHDFTLRGEDLFMLTPIIPAGAPEWVSRPYLRWQLADEAAEASGGPEEIRAWHICGDLKPGLTRGQWVDQVEAITRAALPDRIVAEIAVHVPQDKPPHAHILIAPRYVTRRCRRYGKVCPDLHRRLAEELGDAWHDWLDGG